MSNSVEPVLNVTLTLAAVAIAGTVVYRQFGPARNMARTTHPQAIRAEKHWQRLWDAGTIVGSPSAPVKIVEVFDLECPFCRRFNATLAGITGQQEGIAVSYVQFPIPGHRFADSGAQAAECAGSEGRFAAFIDLVYAKQDSIGFKSWQHFAHDAGVADTSSFAECIAHKRFQSRIDVARAAAESATITGTPTVMINGWRFANPPSEQELRSAIAAVRGGRKPQIAEPAP